MKEKQREETQDEQLPLNPTRKSVIVLVKQAEGELGGGADRRIVGERLVVGAPRGGRRAWQPAVEVRGGARLR